jgi:anti-anti-sigma regulatory factor
MTISPYLAITTEQHGQQLVLRLQGELDVSNVDSLRQVLDGLLERAPQTLVVALVSTITGISPPSITESPQLRASACRQ